MEGTPEKINEDSVYFAMKIRPGHVKFGYSFREMSKIRRGPRKIKVTRFLLLNLFVLFVRIILVSWLLEILYD